MGCPFAILDFANIDDLLNWNISDLDKELKEEERLKLAFEPDQNEQPISSDLFILLEGQYLLKLAYETLLTNNKDVKKICTIPGTEFGVKNQSIIFKYKNSNVLIAAFDVDSHHSAEVTELLRPYAELAKNVITLHTKSVVDYQREIGAGDLQDVTFLRGINSKLSHIKELKAPNMISGIGAGVASWRAFKQLPVSSYIFFVRHIRIDDESAKKVIKLLRDIGLKDTLDYAPKKHDSSLFI